MLKVLLIDDDPEELELITSAFDSLDVEARVFHASDCVDVHDTLKHHNPDIVFMDINMPYFNGIDCLKTVRADSKFSNLPIIIYSTSSDKNDVQKAFTHKADLYVVKPTTYNKLTSAIEKVLSIDWHIKPQLPIEKFLIA